MTTGMERLEAAASGGIVDRIPVFCNLLDQGARALGMPLREYYSNGEHVAEAQLKMSEAYGYDCLWSLFYVGKEAELLGCRSIVFADDGPPNVGEMVIRTYDDIQKLEVPADVAEHPVFAESLKCLRILRHESGGQRPICAYLTASLTLPAILMGMDKWIELLLGGPAEVRDELLSKCSEFFRKEAKAYRDAGADVLLYSNPFGSLDVVPEGVFESLSIPWMVRDLEAGGTDGVVYYCGGACLNDVLSRVRVATGIGTYYLSPFDDVAEAKMTLDDKAMVFGVINDIRLVDWNDEEIFAEVRRLLSAGMPGGRFGFGTLVMPLAIPEAHIRTMLRAAYELGRV